MNNIIITQVVNVVIALKFIMENTKKIFNIFNFEKKSKNDKHQEVSFDIY